MTEEERVGYLEHLLTNFRIMASDGIWAEGSLIEGYAIDTSNLGGGVGGIIGVTGACCFPDGSCTPSTESACEGVGGVYQGDGTTCSPNPCEPVEPPPPCNGCGFDAFDGSGRQFLSSSQIWDDTYHYPDCPGFDPDEPFSQDCHADTSQTFDPNAACAGALIRTGNCHLVFCDEHDIFFDFLQNFIIPSNPGVVVVSATMLTLDLNEGCPAPCVETHVIRILTDECTP